MTRCTKIRKLWVRNTRGLTLNTQGSESKKYHMLNHFRLESTTIRWTLGRRTSGCISSDMECLYMMLFWLWRMCGTIRNDMTLLLTIIAQLIMTIISDMTKLFARKALHLWHITTFTFIVGSICNWIRLKKSNIMSHGSLGKSMFFFLKKLTNTCIQRWNNTPIQQNTYDSLKLRMKFYEELITLTSVVDFSNCRE